MQDVSFQANPDASLQVFAAGEEQTPIIVIDDFAVDTSDIIRYACESVSFEVDETSAYPGVRAYLSRGHVIAAVNPILELLYKAYSIPLAMQLRPVSTFYSLVSTPSNELRPMQRIPHFDCNRPYYFAITHYLDDGAHGGTGLYRHKPTGFENITEERLGEYIKAGDKILKFHGDPVAEYFTGSDDHFELFATIDYKPNRLVVYPGTLLHSGLIDPATDINPNPKTGRLTSNIFVEFQ